jgi:hypothetical protein
MFSGKKLLCAFLVYFMRATRPAHPILLDFIALRIFDKTIHRKKLVLKITKLACEVYE